MTAAPLASTIVSIGLIPVAFLFVHAFYSGRKQQRIHPITGAIAICWDLALSIGYMMYRTVTIEMTPLLTVYFSIHGLIAVIVMALEISVLAIGIVMIRRKSQGKWHRKLTKILFPVWWFAFLSGEVVYVLMYLI
jgi:uncharacterized membrane protein YozB (DUF420 family)